MKIRTWDKVKIISGKTADKGQVADVLAVDTKNWKILVKGVNMVTRHIKKMWTNPGQIIKMEKAIDSSNVMLVCPFTEKATRVGYVELEEKWKTKKFRFSKAALKEKWGEASKYIIK